MGKSGNDGRLDEVPVALDDVAAELDLPAELLHLVQGLEVAVDAGLRVHRPVQGPVVEGVTQPLEDRGVGLLEPINHLVVDLLVNDEPAKGCAPATFFAPSDFAN